ncbi:MAG: phosphatase [Oscillospiraceae bacterium]|nr:phosphatase [Oscillospiraceae bacterium]
MNICADLHTHTVASTHAYSTVAEMAAEAARKGLKAIAFTDHTPASTDGPHIWHFHNLHKAIPRELYGVKIIYGAEASVSDYEGRLDFPQKECEALDWIIGSVHTEILPSHSVEKNTETYLKLAENPLVDVIGHPANVKFLFDYEKGLKKIRECGKLVELNESTIRWKNTEKNYIEILKLCKKYEIPIIVNTDAHFMTAAGDFTESLRMLDELDFPEKLVFNADWERVREHINKKHGII